MDRTTLLSHLLMLGYVEDQERDAMGVGIGIATSLEPIHVVGGSSYTLDPQCCSGAHIDVDFDRLTPNDDIFAFARLITCKQCGANDGMWIYSRREHLSDTLKVLGYGFEASYDQCYKLAAKYRGAELPH